MYYNNYQPTNALSAFNEGIFQIQRLNDIWKSCRLNSLNDDVGNWALELEAAWRELIRDAEKKKPKYIPMIDKLDNLIGRCYSMKEGTMGKDIVILNKPFLRKLLSKKERLLRRLQDEAGKGSRYEDPDADDFE